MAKRFQISLVLLCLPIFIYPQNQSIKFERISVEQGLSNSVVMSILQDHQGFMWFATGEGLNKYDGYKFTIYRHDPYDSNSLGSNDITSLYEDPSGNLWISSIDGGLNRYNRDEDNFFKYMPERNNPESISSDDTQQTVAFQYSGKDILWIGTLTGLHKMDIAAQKFTHYPHTKKDYPYSYVVVTAVDSNGYVWIGCAEGGLYKFDPWKESFTNYQYDPGNAYSLSDNDIEALWVDRFGILWIGTGKGGLNKFDQKKQQFSRYQHDPNNPHSLSHNHVTDIHEDRAGILWVGTAFDGLNRFNRETGQFIHYKHDSGNPYSLGDNTVTNIYEDKSGVLWVGTWEGIYKYDPGKNQFSNYMNIPGNQNSLSVSFIGSIHASDYGGQKTLWIGTKTGGLNKLDRSTEKFTHYIHDPNNSKSIPSNNICALFEDRSGFLWIGTWGQGLVRFDPGIEQFTQYIVDVDNPISTTSNIIRSIFEDKMGTLWIGTQTAGLIKFNREKETFSRVGFKTSVMKIYEDNLGVLWIGAYWKLFKLNRETEKYTSYMNNPDDPKSISNSLILSIHEDKTGRLWFGTHGGGLNKFKRESEEFLSYTMKDGLPNNVIKGILEDKQGNLWLSTNNGLSKFNPDAVTFRNYDIHDGLAGNQFFTGAYAVSKDGEMFFGGAKGLNAFYPERLKDNSHIPKIVITDFQLFSKSVGIKKVNDFGEKNTYLLNQHISLTKEIILSYQENIFSFEFAALDYYSPQKNQYAYKMEGVDPDWVYTDASRRFATYTHLDPGEYVFKVKGSNNDGLWNEEGTSLKVIITPPWWLSGWAYAAYIIFLIVMIFTTWRFQLRRVHLRNELKMKSFQARQLQEIDHMKSRFFANISHEFRTPLTLIQGPVNQMISGEFKGNLKEQYHMILRNSNRLLRLINQILDLSKLESGRMKLKASRIDIIEFLRGVVQSFSSLAERKKISLKVNTTEKSLLGYVDGDKLEKIVTNLLSNAFKFTPEGGEVTVVVNIPLNPPSKGDLIESPIEGGARRAGGVSKRVQINISNTGPGIAPDQLQRIFDRFYQADNSYKKDSEGTGIGLALTKEIVQACHGEIRVESEQNKCTTFTVLLPIGKEHLKEEEIVEETETGDGKPEIGKQVLSDRDARYQIPDSKELSSSSIPYPESPLEGLSGGQTGGVTTEVQSKSSAQPPVSGLRYPLLLIVEDNPDVTSYISSFMENDYRIITAENGKIGLKKTLDKYPDLIISDVMMPEMDGFEFCEKVKSDERTSHIPIILLTAKADLNSKIEGLEFGADDYINKPFEAGELKIRTKNLINQRRKLRETFSQLIDLRPEDISASSMDEKLLQRLLSIFENHIEEPEFGVENLAREVGISRVHLNRKIQALTNRSTSDFIRTLRLQRAAQMLSKASGTVSEIAYKVGFSNLSHFSKTFRKHFGQLPSDFSMNKK